MATEAGRVYKLTYNPRPWAAGLFAASLLVFGAIGTGPEPDGPNIALMILGALTAIRAGQITLYWLIRVVVRDAGIDFYALARHRFVSWSNIRAVRVSRRRYGGGITWRLTERPHIATAATFDHLHRLLVDVEHHAPHAQVTG